MFEKKNAFQEHVIFEMGQMLYFAKGLSEILDSKGELPFHKAFESIKNDPFLTSPLFFSSADNCDEENDFTKEQRQRFLGYYENGAGFNMKKRLTSVLSKMKEVPDDLFSQIGVNKELFLEYISRGKKKQAKGLIGRAFRRQARYAHPDKKDVDKKVEGGEKLNQLNVVRDAILEEYDLGDLSSR